MKNEPQMRPNAPRQAREPTPEEIRDKAVEFQARVKNGLDKCKKMWDMHGTGCPMCGCHEWTCNPNTLSLPLTGGQGAWIAIVMGCKTCCYSFLLPAMEIARRGSLVELPPGTTGG